MCCLCPYVSVIFYDVHRMCGVVQAALERAQKTNSELSASLADEQASKVMFSLKSKVIAHVICMPGDKHALYQDLYLCQKWDLR